MREELTLSIWAFSSSSIEHNICGRRRQFALRWLQRVVVVVVVAEYDDSVCRFSSEQFGAEDASSLNSAQHTFAGAPNLALNKREPEAAKAASLAR